MGSTHAPKRCSLSKAVANGKPTRRRHAHIHSGTQPGINFDIAADLEANFVWAPPLAPQTQNVDEIDAAFALLEYEKNPWNEY
ncbi:hypothetical protein BDR04DRAFT_768668 [Suillus decipiens]|nr:hypothetical protein BDR04DRAFT_768668 [Suillus decipiens]